MHGLSDLYQVEHWPFSQSDIPPKSIWKSFKHLEQIPVSFAGSSVGLLLGQADAELLKVLESVSGDKGQPYATKHVLGWSLQGLCDEENKGPSTCLRTATGLQNNEDLGKGLEALYRAEFSDPNPDQKGDSQADKLWEQRVQSSICYKNDKLQIGLPFRDENAILPDNRSQALKSAQLLKIRLNRDQQLKQDYVNFMENMVSKGYLEPVPVQEKVGERGKVWYLVHHPVHHKVKKKLRVVFDCSRKFQGVSLNNILLQGPDLLNNLVGVLLRFREHPIAFIGDIEQMFLQIKVPQSHSDFMRIIWWESGDLDSTPKHYRLTCHTFGAISSPSIANFAVKRAADLAEEDSTAAKHTLAYGAYMDDVLCSSQSVENAYDILIAVRKAANAVGFNLRGIMSNSRQLLSKLPTNILSSHCQDLDIGNDALPQDRVLGVVWRADRFLFIQNQCAGVRIIH